MALEVVRLEPTSWTTASPTDPLLTGAVVTESTVDPYVTFGGGAIDDDSDASGIEIGAWAEETVVNFRHIEPVVADFHLDASQNPLALAVGLRVRTPSGYVERGGNRLVWQVLSTTADGYLAENSGANDLREPIAFGTVATPTTIETWDGRALDYADPLSETWFRTYDSEAPFVALTGAGLRLRFFIQKFTTGPDGYDTGRIPWVDLLELRLVLLCDPTGEPPPTPTTESAVRLYPRERGGLASAPRLYPPPRDQRLVGGHQ